MPDRLVFDEAAAHELFRTLRAVVQESTAPSGTLALSGPAATAALEQFRAAMQRVADGVDEDLEALGDFLSAASEQLMQVDIQVAASARKAVKK